MLSITKLARNCGLLSSFQIIARLIFFTQSLATRFIKKFVQNIIFFIVTYFLNTSSSEMT